MKNKSEHCCDDMKWYADKKFIKEHQILKYHSYIRAYRFTLHGYNDGLEQEMDYCPWCGTQLPKKLNKEWSDIIDKECGTSDETFDREAWLKLPKEFRTDQWWKKRGL